jgi:exopolysaccharide biosynthesis polyprenyl glycosylphosphotransferase
MNSADIHLHLPSHALQQTAAQRTKFKGSASTNLFSNLIITASEPVIDALCVCAAVASASRLILWLSTLGVGFASPHSSSAIALPSVILVLLLMERTGAYRPAKSLLRVRETGVLLKVSAVAGMTLFVLKLAGLPGTSLVEAPIYSVVLFVFLLFEKTVIHSLEQTLHRRGVTPRRIAIVGSGLACRRIYSTLVNSPRLRMWPAVVIDPLTSESGQTIAESAYRIKQTTAVQCEELNCAKVKALGAEKLLVVASSFGEAQLAGILRQASSCGIEVEICTGDVASTDAPVECTDIDGLMFWRPLQTNFQQAYQIIKRVVDATLAAFLLFALAPILLGVSAALKLTSPGPVFFRQVRVGKSGRYFSMLKFRSMHQHACGDSYSPKSGTDARISKVGRILRKTSLDELPQLFNVLRGEMSLVGPRPEMPFIVQHYTPLQFRRLEVMPGITGLWQLSAHRKDLIHDNMQYDLYYVRHQGLFLDLAVLIHTALFAMKGV